MPMINKRKNSSETVRDIKITLKFLQFLKKLDSEQMDSFEELENPMA